MTLTKRGNQNKFIEEAIENVSDIELTSQTVRKLHDMADYTMSSKENKLYLKNVLPSERQLQIEADPSKKQRYTRVPNN